MAPKLDPTVELLGLPPQEALAYWQKKVPLPAKEFYALHEAARVNAFTVSGVARMDLMVQIQDSLRKALAEGQSFGSWKKGLKAEIEGLGWTGKRAWRLDTIFRTNVQGAYQVGRYKQMQAVKALRPFWQYSAVLDRRARPTHRALHGKVFPADHPFWNTWYPPNGYRCRCTVKSLSQRQVEARGLTVEPEIPQLVETEHGAVPLWPDKGFETNQAKAHYQPDLASYPPQFRQAFLERLLDDACPQDWAEFADSPCFLRLKRGLRQRDLDDLETLVWARRAGGVAGYGDWVEAVAKRSKPSGELYPLGLLPWSVLSRLPKQPRLALVVIDDVELLHALRVAKLARDQALLIPEMKAIPDKFRVGEWLINEEDASTLLCWQRIGSEKWLKVVIRTDRKVGKSVANQVITCGVVERHNLDEPKYRKL